MEQGTRNREHEAHASVGGFKKLLVWQRGDDLASEIFQITEQMNQRHRWLGLQMIKAATSVTANISEGYGRSSLGDYLRFLEIAGGSLNEVENFLHFTERNKIIPKERLALANKLRWATGNLLFGLSKSLRNRQPANGSWQRGLREVPSEYDASSDDEVMFHVPSSMFQPPEEAPHA